jgi:hypothetical protein
LPEGDEYRHLKLGGLPRLVFKNFEDTIYPRARAAAERLDSVAQGEERAITHVDPIIPDIRQPREISAITRSLEPPNGCNVIGEIPS